MEIIQFHSKIKECRDLLPYTLIIDSNSLFRVKVPFTLNTFTTVKFLTEGKYLDVDYTLIGGYLTVKKFSNYTHSVGRLVVQGQYLGGNKDLYYSDTIIVTDYYLKYFNNYTDTISFKCKESDTIQHLPLHLELVQSLPIIYKEDYKEVSTKDIVNVVSYKNTRYKYRTNFLATELITRFVLSMNNTWFWINGKRTSVNGEIEVEEVENGNFSVLTFYVTFNNNKDTDIQVQKLISKEDNNTLIVKEDNNTFLIKE